MFDRQDYMRQYRIDNRVTINRHKRREAKKLSRFYRDQVIEMLGGKCCKCGIDDDRVLQVDHIKPVGGRASERSLGSSLWNVRWKMLLNGYDNFQLLCANCHLIKTLEDRM